MVRKSVNWKYNIGENIKDDKRDIVITDRNLFDYKYKDKNGKEHIYRYQQYFYKCNICGFNNGKILLSNINKGVGCSCCSGRTVVKGINDISTLRNDLLKYFVDINDAYTNTIYSSKKVECKCPICNHKKYISVSNLSQHGFSCNYCSDGISYPEKFIASLLVQLGVKHIYQYKIDNYKYKYDFYLENYNLIIEVNGEQHYTNTFINAKIEDIKDNDLKKKELALSKGYKYIEIDCSKSELDYIKNSIMNNDFFINNFNLNTIDWELCNKCALKNKLIEICEYWNKNQDIKSVPDLVEYFKMGYTTILKYLHIGNDIGLCVYDKSIEFKKKGKKTSGLNNPMYGKKVSDEKREELIKYSREYGIKKSKKVCQYSLDNVLIDVHESINSIKRKFGYSTYAITECCNGNRKTAYKYKWKWFNN